MGWEHVNILRKDYEARLNKERVENSELGNTQDVFNRDVTIKNKRSYAEVVTDNVETNKEG